MPFREQDTIPHLLLSVCTLYILRPDRKCAASDLTARGGARDLYTRPLIGCPSEPPGFRFAAAITPDPRCCSGLYPPFVSQATRQNGMYSQSLVFCCYVCTGHRRSSWSGGGRGKTLPGSCHGPRARISQPVRIAVDK